MPAMNSAPSQEPGCVPVLDDAMESHSGAARWGVQRMKNRFRATLVKLASQRSMNFAFVDQVLVSGSNFVAGILLARAFGIFEFGRFALAWMFVEFIGSLQFAAIIQPMLNIGPKQPEANSDRYYDAVIVQQAAACMVFGLVAWLSATAAFVLVDLSGTVPFSSTCLCAIGTFQNGSCPPRSCTG